MSSSERMLNLKTWIPVMIAVFVVVAIACGAEASSAPAEPTVAADDSPSSLSAATQADNAVQSAPETASGGLEEACVQSVLGRAAGGFGDVTAAERDAIFQQCSGNEEEQRNRQFAGGLGGDFLDAINLECLAGITGSEDLNLGDLTLEERQRVFSECVPEDLAQPPGRQGGAGGGLAGRLGGAFADLDSLLEDCVTDAVGETPENFFGLEPAQLEAIAEACGDELPEGFGADGTGGFGGFRGQGGPDGGGGGGFFGGGAAGGADGAGGFPGGRGGFRGFDFASECVSGAVGHPVEGPADLTPDDFQKILETCA